MGLRLPKDGYDAMVLLNQLSNHGGIAGVGYQTKKENGQIYLIAIRAQLSKPLLIDKPNITGKPGGLLKLPANVG